MAQKKKTSTTNKKQSSSRAKSSASKSSTGRAGTSKSNTGGARSQTRGNSSGKGGYEREQKRPVRREVGGVICLFLSVLVLLGYFNVDAIFISLISNLLKGLTGWGFYCMVPSLLICAYILEFHHGRPVALRVTCGLLLPVFVGALLHILFSRADYQISVEMFKALYSDGIALTCGGAVSGALAEIFSLLISSIGAFIIFFITAVIMIFAMFNVTISGIVTKFKERERVEYEPEMTAPGGEVKAGSVGDAELRRGKSAQSAYAASYAPREGRKMQQLRSDIDLPVDDPIGPEELPPLEKKKNFFNSMPRVKTPDQVLMDHENIDISAVEMLGDSELQRDALRGGKAQENDLEQGAFSVAAENIAERTAAGNAADAAFNVFGETDEAGRKEPESKKHPAPERLSVEGLGETGLNTKREHSEASETEKTASQAAFQADLSDGGFAAEVADNMAAKIEDGRYIFPPVGLLDSGKFSKKTGSREEVQLNKDRLEAALGSFGINASISNIIRGPSITRYEMELEAGTKLNKITNLADDIALSLGVASVRIAAIPNKIATVGIEVPNKDISTV